MRGTQRKFPTRIYTDVDSGLLSHCPVMHLVQVPLLINTFYMEAHILISLLYIEKILLNMGIFFTSGIAHIIFLFMFDHFF
jgi:hypothetical protein